MERFTATNTLPLSIAQVDSTAYAESGLVSAPAKRSSAEVLALHERLLTAVVTRVGEVEAAEWALDQAKAACQVQINAALSSGVPAERVAAAAGICVSALADFIGGREPVPGQG